MVVGAARISHRLRATLDRADDGRRPIAEVWRQVGAEAERLGAARPSYEAVRLIVQARRERGTEPTTAQIAVDVAFRARPVDAFLEHWSGIRVPPL